LLVVELDDGPGMHARTIVADAWYSMLPNGNAEFAITVAKPWRGGLGTALLDELREVAAANGVPNLEAEVMLRNRPMLSLARRLGCVRLADDGASVRVEIPARGAVPSWPPKGRHPRVLVEGRTGWHAQDAAMRRGMEVAVCAGPAGRHVPCPLLNGGTCPLVEGADAIVVSLGSHDESLDELVRMHRLAEVAHPLVVEERIDADIVSAVEQALADGRPPSVAPEDGDRW
jgi:hypothetical protein